MTAQQTRAARRAPDKPAASCPECLAWGVLYGGYCRACYDFRRCHPRAACAVCARVVPLKNSHCRLCWLQAASLSMDPPVVTKDDLARVTCHQLWFAGMTKMRGPCSGVRLRAGLRGSAVALRSPEPKPLDSGQLQLHLPGAGRAFDRARHAEPTSPALVRARRIAQALGEGRGWNTKLAAELDRALVILLSGHGDGEQFHYSDLIGVLHRYGVSINRVAEVLAEMGLLLDDRVPAFDTWLADKLTDLAPGIAADVRDWAQVLRHGGPRSQPRNINTVRRYVRAAHPVLVEWSTRYDHLREATTGDINAVADALHGHLRRRTLGALRSLTRHCKKNGTIFADPAARVRIGHRDEPIILPLGPNQIHDATQAATTPAARIALALAAVHAARPEAIRTPTPRRRRPRQPAADHRLGDPPARRAHPPAPNRLAGIPAHTLAQHRQPAPDHQQTDRLDHPSHQRQRAHRAIPPPNRHPGSLTRRPSTRRSAHPRPRPAPPGRRVRTRRDHSNPILRSRATDPPNPSRGTRSTGLSTNPRINSPQIH